MADNVGSRLAAASINRRSRGISTERCADSLSEIEEPVELVNVFRPAEEAPGIAREAVALGARFLWLQNGIVSEEASRIAEEAGLTVVMDLCIAITHGDLGLGIGVKAWKEAQEAARSRTRGLCRCVRLN